MIEAIVVTLLPVGFLVILFGGGALFRRRNVDMDGEAPIDRRLFYVSKYSIVILWGAMVLQTWGILSVVAVPRILQVAGLGFWSGGFVLLYLGRYTLGSSFRLGTPKEGTSLRVDGLFRFSRNPMYAGVYATIIGSSLYTLNPVVVVLGAFVIAIHHSIVLAEERYLQKAFGEEYAEYSRRVRRYI